LLPAKPDISNFSSSSSSTSGSCKQAPKPYL
jgi:hypothetical protein